ncbi:MAG: LLM class flavin-dependent oxidoreductase [Dehalococcoidia bacterium]|nr:LLM class flavin-dependent oxidoreductase [Dehalococcoidia bacterium]
MVALSVLDQSPIRSGGTAAQALRESIELAELCDRLGYRRYWIAEHHSSGGLASASPEILIGQVAARTEHMRVGSGGVMLTHYAPLKVAEQFRMLEALYPGRIDLGVGRAPGSDTKTAGALANGTIQPGLEQYPDQLMDLYGFLRGDIPPGHPFHGIRAMPDGDTMPALWLLGSSAASAMHAADLGWAFCFAHFIQPEGGDRIVARYRERFRPSPVLDAPLAMVAVSATVADTDEEAEYHSWSRWAWRISAGRGARGGILSPEEAMAQEYTEAELDYLAFMRRNSLYGSPGTVRDRLDAIAAAYAVDEIMVVTITHSFAARKGSYELLAAEYGLDALSAPAP